MEEGCALPPDFKAGKVVNGRWRVTEKIGAGGCGAVYEVSDVKNKRFSAALKVESNSVGDEGVLKLEAEVLRRLCSLSAHVIRLISAGKRLKYSFLVMTLCGPDLMFLRRMRGVNKYDHEQDHFSLETTLRIGVHCLYAIKQVHEIGFVHRDVKPGNMVIGVNGRDARTVFMIDYEAWGHSLAWKVPKVLRSLGVALISEMDHYRRPAAGMVRSFTVHDARNGKLTLRKPRKKVLLRGTLRYCSPNVHRRLEQGRHDDLWSLLYMLVELCAGLPWNGIKDENVLFKMKESIGDSLLKKCPAEFKPISDHLKTLKYEDRPDYLLIYDELMKGVRRLQAHFVDAYDWEDDKDVEEAHHVQTALSIREEDKKHDKRNDSFALDFRLYPTTDRKNFSENILGW
ncbi:Tau-tubulin kinase 1 [Toxocara canis]|uniref:non-specific serine/threonine protein kinase n=1 Tax=Toxocara canis TaxID=6265 RepID=A0A0B2V2W0_TOXCA|nr:Tau-tubulin kinase 1 [Toxocara canis]